MKKGSSLNLLVSGEGKGHEELGEEKGMEIETIDAEPEVATAIVEAESVIQPAKPEIVYFPATLTCPKAEDGVPAGGPFVQLTLVFDKPSVLDVDETQLQIENGNVVKDSLLISGNGNGEQSIWTFDVDPIQPQCTMVASLKEGGAVHKDGEVSAATEPLSIEVDTVRPTVAFSAVPSLEQEESKGRVSGSEEPDLAILVSFSKPVSGVTRDALEWEGASFVDVTPVIDPATAPAGVKVESGGTSTTTGSGSAGAPIFTDEYLVRVAPPLDSPSVVRIGVKPKSGIADQSGNTVESGSAPFEQKWIPPTPIEVSFSIDPSDVDAEGRSLKPVLPITITPDASGASIDKTKVSCKGGKISKWGEGAAGSDTTGAVVAFVALSEGNPTATLKVGKGCFTAPGRRPNVSALYEMHRDWTKPTCLLSQRDVDEGDADAVSGRVVRFTATFSKPVNGFTAKSVSVSGGEVNASSLSPVGDIDRDGAARSYEFDVEKKPLSKLQVKVPKGAVKDRAGNENKASDMVYVLGTVEEKKEAPKVHVSPAATTGSTGEAGNETASGAGGEESGHVSSTDKSARGEDAKKVDEESNKQGGLEEGESKSGGDVDVSGSYQGSEEPVHPLHKTNSDLRRQWRQEQDKRYAESLLGWCNAVLRLHGDEEIESLLGVKGDDATTSLAGPHFARLMEAVYDQELYPQRGLLKDPNKPVDLHRRNDLVTKTLASMQNLGVDVPSTEVETLDITEKRALGKMVNLLHTVVDSVSKGPNASSHLPSSDVSDILKWVNEVAALPENKYLKTAKVKDTWANLLDGKALCAIANKVDPAGVAAQKKSGKTSQALSRESMSRISNALGVAPVVEASELSSTAEEQPRRMEAYLRLIRSLCDISRSKVVEEEVKSDLVKEEGGAFRVSSADRLIVSKEAGDESLVSSHRLDGAHKPSHLPNLDRLHMAIARMKNVMLLALSVYVMFAFAEYFPWDWEFSPT